jgi:4-hydroxy-3-polyprenylbenzoate decarboxylase
MERARGLWERLELPPLKPRDPWYGQSLGFWPDDYRRLVAMAEAGREEEAAEELWNMGQRLEGRDPVGRGMGMD